MSIEKTLYYLGLLLPNLLISLKIMGFTFLFGIFFGAALAAAKLSRHKILRQLAYRYTSLMRGAPTIILLFIVYYGLPTLLRAAAGMELDAQNKLLYIIVTLVLFSSSQISELIRAAYEAIPKGQMEAALSIGETQLTAIRRIILPQAALVILPNLADMVVSLMKEASLAFVIGVVDILGRINLLKLNAYGKNVVEMYIAGTLIFWCFSLLTQLVCSLLERRLSRHKQA